MTRLLLSAVACCGLVAAESLEDLAQRFLSERKARVAAIATADQARVRQTEVRAKVLELIGGLPAHDGPLNARVMGTLARPGFVIEKVIFESLPQFYVTANVYRPEAPGRYPAVLIPMGHWDAGKAAAQLIAANLALKGFVAMPFDPVGQAEREQAYDARVGRSLIGGGTNQHFLNGAQALLVGQSFARYRIWDAKRSIDYLTSRADVDGERIGVTGCSGGGTVTTYIAALDERVKAAAPACYITSFEKLFSGSVGDSEQSFYRFLSSGLDQADYIELFAPRPWLIASTEGDFFPIAGTKIAFEEAKRWYSLFGAEDRIKWVVGKGGHGTPLEVREGIYDWMIRWLKDGKGDAKEQAVETLPEFELRVTPNGHVAGRELYDIIREVRLQKGTRDELRAAVQEWVAVEPPKTSGPPAAGAVPVIRVPDPVTVREYVGDYETATRALLVGRTLPGIRAAEVIAAIGNRPQADVVAQGASGVAALLAAAADPRIRRVYLDRTPFSFRAALHAPITRNLYQALIPGFALKWDLSDLVELVGRDRVVWLDPTDWLDNVVRLEGAPFRYTSADANVDRTALLPKVE